MDEPGATVIIVEVPEHQNQTRYSIRRLRDFAGHGTNQVLSAGEVAELYLASVDEG